MNPAALSRHDCPDLALTLRLSRRRLFQFGGVSLLNGGLLNLLAADTAKSPARRGSAKACILLFQVGGPYQCDTFDPKPDAPEEMRGQFKPQRTNVPGLLVTEALPRVAQHAEKFAVLRGVHHTIRCHNPAIYCSLVGRESGDPMAISKQTVSRRLDHPHYASVLAKLRPAAGAMPHHVIIPDVATNGASRSPGL